VETGREDYKLSKIQAEMFVKVSVIVANHKTDKLFFNTVESVLKNMPSWAELIVVNNGMKVKEADKVRRWLKGKPVKLVNQQTGNPAKARNKGVRASLGKYLVFLDNDTQVKKGWLDKVVRYMEENKGVGAGQLKLLRLDRKKVFDSAGDKLTSDGFLAERAREAEDMGQFDQAEPIFSGKGAAMLVCRDVFDKIGGFDEDYVYYWEEPDLFWRVWKAGYEVRFLWMGTVYHAYGTKEKPIPRLPADSQVYLACRNQLMTILKNGVGRSRRRMLRMVVLSWLGIQGMFLIRGKWKQNRAIERAIIWLVMNRKRVARKRRWVQKNLSSDDQWMKQVMIKQKLSWYVGKGVSYVLGRGF